MAVGSPFTKASCCSWLAFWMTAWMAAVAGSLESAVADNPSDDGEAPAAGPGVAIGGGVDVDGAAAGAEDELGPPTAWELDAPDAAEQPVSASDIKSTSV